jgi:hypothetical protein
VLVALEPTAGKPDAAGKVSIQRLEHDRGYNVSLRPLANEVAADTKPRRGSELFGQTSHAVKYQSNHKSSSDELFYIGIDSRLKF